MLPSGVGLMVGRALGADQSQHLGPGHRDKLGCGVSVPQDLLCDPDASPWDYCPGGRTQCFSDAVKRGLWGWGRCDWGGGAAWETVSPQARGPYSLLLLPLKLLN